MTKTVNKYAAQGDFLIVRVDEIPSGLILQKPEGAHHIIAHSETGHNHVMLAERVDAYVAPKKEELWEMFLDVKSETDIEHLRSYDTHETLRVPVGQYLIKRQREYTPEGFRRAAD